VHIVHHSSSDALPMLRKARSEGLPITVETCPHYLTFAAEEIALTNRLALPICGLQPQPRQLRTAPSGTSPAGSNKTIFTNQKVDLSHQPLSSRQRLSRTQQPVSREQEHVRGRLAQHEEHHEDHLGVIAKGGRQGLLPLHDRECHQRTA